MNGNLTINMVDADEEAPGPLAALTPVDVTFADNSILVQTSRDRSDSDHVLYPRTVMIEVNSDDELRVLAYPLDRDEPVSIRLRLDGTYEVEDLGK